MADYATVEDLVDALLGARTLRAIARTKTDAEDWLSTHNSRKDQAMIATAMEAVEMLRTGLLAIRAAKS